MKNDYTVYVGDCLQSLRQMPDHSVQTCVTSPPYFGLRDYGQDGQIGLEQTPDEYVARLVEVFREVRRVLRDDGTLWLNLGDSYGATGGDTHTGFNQRWSGTGGAGSKQDAMLNGLADRKHQTGLRPKNLLGIPWRVAFALQADGWYLRQDIIWSKPNPMPESVRDRCTKSHEYVFLLSKSPRYYYDAEAVKESCSPDMQRRAAAGHTRGANGKIDASRQDACTLRGDHVKAINVSNGRNRRSVWTVTTKPFKGAHFAVFPPDLIEPCVLAGTSEKGCCSECGASWERVVSKSKTFQSGSGLSGNPIAGKQDLSASKTNSTPDIRLGPCVKSTTTGWRPTCDCNATVVPCAVLDPFGGSGTTAGVALKYGRRAVICELNPEYAAMVDDRIKAIWPQYNDLQQGFDFFCDEPDARSFAKSWLMAYQPDDEYGCSGD